jgi:hypothetical protein
MEMLFIYFPFVHCLPLSLSLISPAGLADLEFLPQYWSVLVDQSPYPMGVTLGTSQILSLSQLALGQQLPVSCTLSTVGGTLFQSIL